MATIGIDVGACNSVIATVTSGRVDLVRNDLSERQTPSLVSFTDEGRQLGDAALSTINTNLLNTCRNMKMVMGRRMEDIESEMRFALAPLAATEMGGVGYKVTVRGEQQVLSVAAVMAAHLAGLKALAERSLGKQVVEAVIAVPSWYGEINIQAMSAAAYAAGLPTLRLFSEHAAVSLDYGIFRASQFSENEAHRVVFVNMGYTVTSVFISDFSTNRLQVIHVVNDLDLGGRNTDEALATIITRHANKVIGHDITTNPKTRYKIETQASKTKKVLSANNDTTVTVEGVHDDAEVSLAMSRGDFNDECKPLQDRLRRLLQNVFTANGGAPVHALELIGGCVRIPWVQQVIEEETSAALGPNVPIRRTLSQDETVARGCALQAAMLSCRYKVRDFKVNDCVVQPLEISWNQTVSVVSSKSGKREPNDSIMNHSERVLRETLVHKGDVYPHTTWISFEPVPRLDVAVAVPTTDYDYALPAACSDVGRYTIEVTPETLAKLTPLATLKVRFELNISRLSGVSATVTDTEQYEETVDEQRPIIRPPADAASDAQTNTEGVEAATTEVPQFETVQVRHTKTRNIRHSVVVKRIHLPGWFDAKQIESLRELELSMSDQDRLWRLRKESMNELESIIYSLRDKLNYGGLSEYFDPQEKQQLMSDLDGAEQWIYDQGHAAQNSDIASKLNTFRDIGDRAIKRMDDARARPAAVTQLLDYLRNTRLACTSNDEAYSHISQEQKHGVLKNAEEVESWLQVKLGEQSRRSLYVDPIISAAEILAKKDDFSKDASLILSQPKPQTKAPAGGGATPPQAKAS